MALTLTLDDNQERLLLQGLGLPTADPGTTDPGLVVATLMDAMTDEISEQPEPDDAGGNGVAAAAKRARIDIKAAKRAGLEVIDASSADALRRDAAEGRRLIAAAAQAKIEAAVDAAIDKGKITPARRKHWISLIAADGGMADVLAATPDECAVPLKELGHATNVDAKDLADASEWFY
jgi:hypothetical protein